MENVTTTAASEERTKFCKYCGGKIHEDAVLCSHCGRQVEELKKAEQPSIVINNSNQNVNSNTNVAGMYGGRLKNKLISFFLCLFLGAFGAHKFYEGRVGMGILYLFTGGLFGIGWFVNCITLLFKPNPYYV